MKRCGFINANIYGREDTAFLVDEGQFILFGSDDQIKKLLLPSEELIDLKQQYVYPGFMDSHLHLVEYGHYLNNVVLKDCVCLEDVKKEILTKIVQGGKFIIGRGYDETKFPEGEILNKEFLDSISKDIPITLTRVCGHQMVVNSKALEVADIDNTTSVDGGMIDLKQGFLEENAINLIHEVWPKETVETIKEAILKACKKLNEKGVTTVGSDDFLSIDEDWKMVLDAYLQLAYQGKMTVRVVEQCEFSSIYEFADFLDEGYTTGVGDDYFQIGPLKLILDGSFGAQTAALSKPYASSKQKGVLLYDDEMLNAYVELANRYNMPTITHVIGDAALDQILDVYEHHVLEGNPLHHGLVHVSYAREDQLERIAKMKLVCYIQSLFLQSDATMLKNRLGEKRAEECYRFKSLNDHVIVCNGSDAPVEEVDPLKGIQIAVERIGNDGKVLNSSESLSVKQAIDTYTSNAKEAMGLMYGSLERFEKADFVVLKEQIETTDPKQISKIQIAMTIMDGEIVFEQK